jgi:hypothetical protein
MSKLHIKKVHASASRYKETGAGGVDVSHIVVNTFKGQFLLFNYYNFLSEYHREPKNVDDFFDGLQVMKTNNKIENFLVNKK